MNMDRFAVLHQELQATLRHLKETIQQLDRGENPAGNKDLRYISRLFAITNRQLDLELQEYNDAQRQAKEARAHFELMFRTSPAASTLVRISDRRIVDCNDAFLALGGYGREEVIGQDHRSFIMYEDSGELEDFIAALLKQGRCDNVPLAYRNKLGATIVALVSAVIVNQNDEPHVLAIARDITDHLAAEAALHESEARIRAITYSMQDAVLIMDPKGRIVYWNPAAERIFGYTEDAAVGQNLHRLLAPQRYQEAFEKGFALFQRTGKGAAIDRTLELEACHRDGHEMSIELSLSVIQLQDGWHASGIIRDITARKKVEEELRASQARYHALVDQSFEALALVDIKSQEVVEVNRRFTEMLGYALPEDGPLYVHDLVVEKSERLIERYNVTLKQQNFLSSEMLVYRHKNGSEVPVERAGSVICLDGKEYLLSSNRDMTEEYRRRQELAASLEELRNKTELLEKTNALLLESQQALLHQATHDPLTGLLNRRAALDALGRELARLARHGGGVAVGMCDIDYFKRINDSCGHQVGDEVLCWVSRFMQEKFREYDVITRFGGEEFLLILPFKAGEPVTEVFDRFRRLIAETPMHTAMGAELHVTVSIGVTFATPKSGMDSLLSEADVALYQAKAAGRNCVVYNGSPSFSVLE